MDKVSSKNVTWFELENPTEEEIAAISKKLLLHPLTAQEVRINTYQPKVERYDEHLYLVLHFPVFVASTNSSISREIDFVLFPYNLITIHYEDIPALDDFVELLAEHEALRERKFGRSSAHLLHSILSLLFTVSKKDLDTIEKRIRSIEEKVFSDSQEIALKEIATLRRDILNFQKALKPQHAVLESLEHHGTEFFGKESKPYFSDIRGEYNQLWDVVQNLREVLDTLYETNISLLSANTNRALKTLTSFTVVLMPATLITFIYSMNVPWVPFRSHPQGLWIVLGFMTTVSALAYQILKKNKWL